MVDSEVAYCLRPTQAYNGEKKQSLGPDRKSKSRTEVEYMPFQEAMYLMLDPEKVGLKLEVDEGTTEL